MDIEYERNGVKKMAGARFKEALKAEGWSVVGEEEKRPRGRPRKETEGHAAFVLQDGE